MWTVASLFIYNSHRSLSLGSLSFQTLQNLATSPPYNANHLTLDTMPFQMIMDEEEVDERGRKMWGRPRWVELGDEEGEARNMKWYRRMGYREFRVSLSVTFESIASLTERMWCDVCGGCTSSQE